MESERLCRREGGGLNEEKKILFTLVDSVYLSENLSADLPSG